MFISFRTFCIEVYTKKKLFCLISLEKTIFYWIKFYKKANVIYSYRNKKSRRLLIHNLNYNINLFFILKNSLYAILFDSSHIYKYIHSSIHFTNTTKYQYTNHWSDLYNYYLVSLYYLLSNEIIFYAFSLYIVEYHLIICSHFYFSYKSIQFFEIFLFFICS